MGRSIAVTVWMALVLTACVSRGPKPATLDTLAERYVRLSLEMGTHEEGYIDAYIGNPSWKSRAEANPRSIATLKSAMDALDAQIEDVQTRADDAAVQRRARTLRAFVQSGRFRLDMMEGTRIAFAEEAERLFGLRPPLRPLESYDATLTQLEALVPGQGPLADRVDAFLNRYIIPADRVELVTRAAIAECRRRTAAHIALPEGEEFELELVKGKSWSAYNWYRGNNHSLIQVNVGLPVRIGAAVTYGCHEGYPGHHVQGIHAERQFRERGWVEYSVMPLFAPMGVLYEGGGNHGIDLAFPGGELAVFERDVLFPLAGLDPATADAYAALRDAMRGLRGASLTIDQMYLDKQVDRSRALELMQRYGVTSRARAQQSLDFADHYRSYVINYSTGEDLVRAFVERAGSTPEARWRAYEGIFLQPTLPADLAGKPARLEHH